jgi:hypothetical protein
MFMSVNSSEMSKASFQQSSRFVRVSSLKRHEAGFRDYFDGKHSRERLILHDENDRRGLTLAIPPSHQYEALCTGISPIAPCSP